MQPEPLFQSFDAGIPLIALGVAVLAAAIWWDVTRNDEPVHDDEDWDVEATKHDAEADARMWPF